MFQRQATASHRVVNQVFGVAAACLLRFSNAFKIADKVVFLSINRCRNRIEPVSNFAYRPAQKAGRGVLLAVHTVLHKITGQLKHLLAWFIRRLYITQIGNYIPLMICSVRFHLSAWMKGGVSQADLPEYGSSLLKRRCSGSEKVRFSLSAFLHGRFRPRSSEGRLRCCTPFSSQQ